MATAIDGLIATPIAADVGLTENPSLYGVLFVPETLNVAVWAPEVAIRVLLLVPTKSPSFQLVGDARPCAFVVTGSVSITDALKPVPILNVAVVPTIGVEPESSTVSVGTTLTFLATVSLRAS